MIETRITVSHIYRGQTNRHPTRTKDCPIALALLENLPAGTSLAVTSQSIRFADEKYDLPPLVREWISRADLLYSLPFAGFLSVILLRPFVLRLRPSPAMPPVRANPSPGLVEEELVLV